MKLTKDDAQALAWTRAGRASDGRTVLYVEVTDRGRWSVYYFTVFQDSDGKLWGFDWESPATESQEVDWPDEVECLPLRAVQVTVTKYEVIK